MAVTGHRNLSPLDFLVSSPRRAGRKRKEKKKERG